MPSVTPLSTETITIALLLAKLPQPRSVTPLPAFGRRHFLVHMQDNEAYIFEEFLPRAHEGLEHLVTLYAFGQSHPSLALPKSSRILTEGLPHPSWIYPVPKGQSGLDLAPPLAYATLGKAMQTIHSNHIPTRGSFPCGKQYIPRKALWSSEMALAATRHASQTVANTRQFQRYMEPLVALVNEYAGDLDAPTQGCLVHGSLKPQTIWIDANGSVTTVVGWQRSLFGDIEQDWALHVLGPYLGDVFEGYGLQRVQDRLNDPTCLGRLKAYTALHILRGFAQTTSRPWSTNTSAKLEAMVVSAEAMQTPNFVAQRVGRAVQNSAPRAGLSLNLFRASTRWALSSLAFNPKPQQSSLLIGALGAIYLAVRHPDQSTELLQFAAKACESLPANGPPNGEFPSVNTQQLLSDLALMVLDDLEARDRIWGQAAASLWLISSAFDILNGEVEPHFAIATEEHIRGLIGSRAEMVEAMHTDGIHNPHQQDFFHGLLVLAALHWMKDVVPTRERDRVRAQTQRTERVFSSAIHKLKLPDQMLGTNATPFSNTLTLLTHTQKLKGAQWAISATIAAHQTLSESNQKLFPAEILFRLLNVDTSRSTRPQSKRGPGIV